MPLKFKDYFDNNFIEDLNTIKFEQGHPLRDQDDGISFGGTDWQNCVNDLRDIPKENLGYFILSLFYITSRAVTIHAKFREEFHQFNKAANYPIFYGGFGGVQNPKKLLLKPIEIGLITEEEIRELFNPFLGFYLIESYIFHQTFIPSISISDYHKEFMLNRGAVNRDIFGPQDEPLINDFYKSLEKPGRSVAVYLSGKTINDFIKVNEIDEALNRIGNQGVLGNLNQVRNNKRLNTFQLIHDDLEEIFPDFFIN